MYAYKHIFCTSATRGGGGERSCLDILKKVELAMIKISVMESGELLFSKLFFLMPLSLMMVHFLSIPDSIPLNAPVTLVVIIVAPDRIITIREL